MDAHRLGELRAERDHDAHRVPERCADADAAHVAAQAAGVREQAEEVAAPQVRLRLHPLEQAGFQHADPQQEQSETERATDHVRPAPGQCVGDEAGDDRAEHADRGDDHRAVTAQVPGQRFGNERHAAAEFARQPDPGQHAPEEVGIERMHEAVRQRGRRIKGNRAEEQPAAAFNITQHAPEDAAEQHPGHLPIEQAQALGDEVITGQPQAAQAGHANDAEKHQVVDVHEIAERADDDGGLQEPTGEGHGGRGQDERRRQRAKAENVASFPGRPSTLRRRPKRVPYPYGSEHPGSFHPRPLARS